MQPYLGSAMSELWPIIRYKFTSALAQWHPADASVISILAPWQRVFDHKDWEKLVIKSIVPKLAAALSNFVINPADQDFDPFDWLMAWADVMPAKHLVSLLDNYFFPKWFSVLRQWLGSDPDHDEVARWYLGWKSLFPQSVLDNEKVKRQMNIAVNLMNEAAQGKTIETTWTKAAADAEPPSAGLADGTHGSASHMYSQQYGHHNDTHDGGGAGNGMHKKSNDYGKAHRAIDAMDSMDMSLKDILERYAEDVGVEFAPKPGGRTYEGLDVYHFGLVSCVVDVAAGLIRAHMGPSRWEATSMEGLLEEHRRREKESRRRK